MLLSPRTDNLFFIYHISNPSPLNFLELAFIISMFSCPFLDLFIIFLLNQVIGQKGSAPNAFVPALGIAESIKTYITGNKACMGICPNGPIRIASHLVYISSTIYSFTISPPQSLA